MLRVTEAWDWQCEMRKVASRFHGTRGVFIQFGDSLTLAAPCTSWAREGLGHTRAEQAFLRWAHINTKNARDGWYLANTMRGEQTPQKISFTAGIGCSAHYLLTGRRGLEPLDALTRRYNPQIALYAIGTSDILRGTPPDEFMRDVETALNALLVNGTIPIVATITPSRDYPARVQDLNAALRTLAQQWQLPLLDLYCEMELRNPNMLDYVSEDGYHLTADFMRGPACAEHLRNCGYLLRGYLTVCKGMQVKTQIIGGHDEWSLPTLLESTTARVLSLLRSHSAMASVRDDLIPFNKVFG